MHDQVIDKFYPWSIAPLAQLPDDPLSCHDSSRSSGYPIMIIYTHAHPISYFQLFSLQT